MTIRPGLLIHPITIERSTATVDETGDTTLTWAPIATRRAEIEQETARIEDGTPCTETTATMRFYWVSGLALEDQVVHGGYAWRIVKIAEPEPRREHEIEAKRIGP